MPERENLFAWFDEVHRLDVRNAMHVNQALRQYSGAVLPEYWHLLRER